MNGPAGSGLIINEPLNTSQTMETNNNTNQCNNAACLCLEWLSSEKCGRYINERNCHMGQVADERVRYQQLAEQKAELEKENRQIAAELSVIAKQMESINKNIKEKAKEIEPIRESQTRLDDKLKKLEQCRKTLSDITEKIQNVIDIELVKRYRILCGLYKNLVTQ